MIIDNTSLAQVKSITLGMENCEEFEIAGCHITDIFIKHHSEKGNAVATDGYIEISLGAYDTISSFWYDMEDETLSQKDYLFGKRIFAYCDVCYLIIENLDNTNLHVTLPYDPLCECLHGNEIELSNCPSLKKLDNGNIKILIGASSEAPRRKDNNYDELILGWENICTKKLAKPLRCKLLHLSTFHPDKPCLRVHFSTNDKNIMDKDFKLIFEDYDHLCIDLFMDGKSSFDLMMSRMQDGRIFVGFDHNSFEFDCACIKEYSYHCAQNNQR